MKILNSLSLALFGFFVLATSSSASELPPCSSPEYRQLDFWIGEWELEYDLPDGAVGSATNTITNDKYGSCVVIENFEMANGYVGGSHSIYDREQNQWRQMWVDNGGGTFTLVGGVVEGQRHIFELRTLQPVGKEQRLRRMIWQDVSENRLVWRWQSQMADGKWKDEWVLRYKRQGT